jgi:hypothetical protein
MGFGLLHQIIPGLLSLTSWISFLTYRFFKSFIASSLHLFFGSASVLILMWFQSVIFLTSYISSILLRCPHHFILRAFIYLTSPPFINVSNSSLLPILHPALQWNGPNISLKSVFQKLINYLRSVQTMSRFRMRRAQIYQGLTISRRHPSLGDIRFRQLVSFPLFRRCTQFY